ncbi:MAG: hypothetical protein KME35_17960 [Aphanocapsa sp. GSE-SYN-MK-11-07L]|nr:hypothetical protein [Aphanocapsa sp. GSE-SYN-MK-11-07L]
MTTEFVSALNLTSAPQIVPASLPVYSPLHVFEFLQSHYQLTEPLVIIGFSAGVVGSIGAAQRWQQHGGQIQALIAIDGWGVPLSGQFPIYRLSHDWFTDWSCQWLGATEQRFYAEPGVGHLDLWRSPTQTPGWQIHGQVRTKTTASQFLRQVLQLAHSL